MLDPKLALEGLKIITAKDAKGALELLNRLLASALGGDAADAEDAPPPAGDGGADEAQEPAAEPMPAARVVVEEPDALAALGRAALALGERGETNG